AWKDVMSLEWLYFVAALLGVARAFAGPALGALAPNLVPQKILPNAIALSSIAGQSGTVVGPAIGGYLYAIGPATPYTASAILFGVSLLGLFLIPAVPRPVREKAGTPGAEAGDGLRCVPRSP